MKKIVICLLAGLLILPVQSAVAEMSWYLGVGGGLTKLRTAGFASTSGLDVDPMVPNLESHTAVSGEFRDDPFGWQVYGGAMFTENFGLVVKYSDSGKGKSQWASSTDTRTDDDNNPLTPPTIAVRDYMFTGQMQMDGFTLYAVQNIPMGEKFSYGIEVGWTSQDIDFVWDSTAVPPPPDSGMYKRDDSGFAFGALMRYKFVEHFALSAEFEWLLVDFGDLIDRPIKLNLNLEYHF